MQNNFTEPCSAHISKSKVRLSFITLYVLGGQTQKDEKKDDERELTAKKKKKKDVHGREKNGAERDRKGEQRKRCKIQRGRVN